MFITTTQLEAIAVRINQILEAGRRAGIQPTSEGTMGIYMLGIQMMMEYSAVPLNEEVMKNLLEGAYDVSIQGFETVPRTDAGNA